METDDRRRGRRGLAPGVQRLASGAEGLGLTRRPRQPMGWAGRSPADSNPWGRCRGSRRTSQRRGPNRHSEVRAVPRSSSRIIATNAGWVPTALGSRTRFRPSSASGTRRPRRRGRKHLEVVGDEADRRDHESGLRARRPRRWSPDVGLEPRHLWRATAALVDDRPSATPTASATSRADSRSWSSVAATPQPSPAGSSAP